MVWFQLAQHALIQTIKNNLNNIFDVAFSVSETDKSMKQQIQIETANGFKCKSSSNGANILQPVDGALFLKKEEWVESNLLM